MFVCNAAQSTHAATSSRLQDARDYLTASRPACTSTHLKQYFKEQRALRTETTINDPLDFQRTKGLELSVAVGQI